MGIVLFIANTMLVISVAGAIGLLFTFFWWFWMELVKALEYLDSAGKPANKKDWE